MFHMIKRFQKIHTWQYSDLFKRNCSVCGKVEKKRFYDDGESNFASNSSHCYWTPVSEGDAEKHEGE